MNGELVPRSQQLLAANVSSMANKIASARLVYLDGAAAVGAFPLSDADMFVPGSEIEILAGSADESETLFKGIVVKHSLKMREHTAPQLILECKHAAATLSVGRKNAYFFDQTDSDVIAQKFEDAGISVDVEAGNVTHKQQIQYGATDWDYCLLRAEANGMVIVTYSNQVKVFTPSISANPVCTLQFGSTILEGDLEMDGRNQFSAVKAYTWDAANQDRVESDAVDSGINQPGNINSESLANTHGQESFDYFHPAITGDEAQKWADARRLYSQINRISGSVKTEGMTAVQVGDVVALDGMGARFNGNAIVTGVRHDFDLVKGWKTQLQFGGVGMLNDTLQSNGANNVNLTPAAGLLPAVAGLQVGVVVSNEDPDGEFRVRVKMPMVNPADEGVWARIACMDAGDDRGFIFRPEVGDEVVVGFFADDPRAAVVLGMLHSSAKPTPEEPSDDNHIKLFKSRSGMKVSFDDDAVSMTLETPEGNALILSDEDGGVTIKDQNGNQIVMSSDGIAVESAGEVTINASSDVSCEAGGALQIKAASEVKVEGSAGVEVSSSAVTKVKGSVLQLN